MTEQTSGEPHKVPNSEWERLKHDARARLDAHHNADEQRSDDHDDMKA